MLCIKLYGILFLKYFWRELHLRKNSNVSALCQITFAEGYYVSLDVIITKLPQSKLQSIVWEFHTEQHIISMHILVNMCVLLNSEMQLSI